MEEQIVQLLDDDCLEELMGEQTLEQVAKLLLLTHGFVV